MAVPLRILFCPHGTIAAFGLFLYYGLYVTIRVLDLNMFTKVASAAGTNNVFAVFLQTSKAHGGYGLSPAENSNCAWVCRFIVQAGALKQRLTILLFFSSLLAMGWPGTCIRI